MTRPTTGQLFPRGITYSFTSGSITTPVDLTDSFSSVVFLLNSNGANNATNFKEVLGKKITAFGNSKYSNIQSKYNNSSLYFDGSGDYLSIQNSTDLDFSSGTDFTIECWVYASSLPSSTSAIISRSISNSDNTFNLDFTPTTLRVTGWYTVYITYAYVMVLNTWQHIAVTRQANTLNLFLNGILVKNYVGTTNFPNTNNFTIGGDPFTGASATLNGYIDELRITKGLARYTTTFTPPTTEFYRPVDTNSSNVSLLLTGKGTNTSTFIYDECGNTCTANGNAQISTTQSKFYGSSIYLDGSSYVRIPLNSNITFGTNSFTWECWIYIISDPTSANNSCIMGNALGGASGNAGVFVAVNNSKIILRHWINGSTTATSTQNVIANTWYQVTAIKDTTNLYIYVNGVLGTAGSTTATNQDTDFTIGTVIGNGGYATNFNGYINDVRITNNAIRYTTTFTPDTYPAILERDTNIDKVVLLMHMNGANNSTTFTDLTNKIPVTTTGSPIISTNQSKFNSSSLYLNGNSDIRFANNNGFVLDGQFTLECFINFSALSGEKIILSKWSSTLGSYQVIHNGTKLGFYWAANSTSIPILISNSGALAINTWYHIAVSRDASNMMRLFIDGIMVANTTESRNSDVNSTFDIGSQVGQLFFNGYIAELRLTKEVARYTANFTIPTKPFPESN